MNILTMKADKQNKPVAPSLDLDRYGNNLAQTFGSERIVKATNNPSIY